MDTTEDKLKVVDVIGVRAGGAGTERAFHCICAADGCLEGRQPNATPVHKWYCRTCWQSSPRVYAYNDAGTLTCKKCGKHLSECGSSHWVSESAMPDVRVRSWDRDHAPPWLRIVRKRWTRAVLSVKTNV